MEMTHPDPFGPTWRARWIWFEAPRIHTRTATRPEPRDPADRIGLFRRTVELGRVPASAPARIWVDGRYVCWVNGSEVARGPVRSDPRQSHYDAVDLAPHLQPGTNVIAVLARHFGEATSWWMPVPASYTLGAGSWVFEAQVGDDWIVSDRSWTCAPGRAWSPVPLPGDVACLPLESFDARQHDHAWRDVDFDDADWVAATEITPLHTGGAANPHPPSEPFGLLRPPVRASFPGGGHHVAAELARWSVHATDPGQDPVAQVLADQASTATPDGGATELILFDLGHIAAGSIEVDLQGAAAGTTVDVAAAEHVDEAGRLVTLGQHAGLRYVASGNEHERFESLDTVGTRYLLASVRAPGGTVPALSLAVRDRHRPRPEGASFECSDPDLQRIFEIGLRTVDLCALDAYVDCPTREQRAWTGDSVVHQMVDLVTNPDWSMAIWHPRLAAMPRHDGMLAMAPASDFAADDRTFIPDWSLHWVRSLHHLYRYTGDRDLVTELLPVAERTLRWFETYLRPDGLLHDVSGWALLDWSSVYSTGASSTMNALWARALEDLADMSRWVGNQGTADWAERRRQGVADAFDRFWDESRGVYVDHVVDGVQRRVAAQHGGATALAAGLVPADRIDTVVARLLDRDRLIRHSWVMDTVTAEGGSSGFIHMVMGYPEPDWDVEEQMVEAQPFFRYVLHDGLARAGKAELLAELCGDWQVFVDAGETTWPECWKGGTRCHGWSSTPTRELIVHVLGVTPAEPGYAAVRVDPRLGGLDWVRATVPTPHGPVTVEAHADGRVDVDSPVPVVRGPVA